MTPQERAAAIIEKWRLKGQGYTGELEDDIAAAIEAVATTTRQEALEEAAQLVCLGCLAGEPRKNDPVLGLIHQRSDERPTQCTAGPIHWLFRRGEAAPYDPR